ncbi:MAG: chemotaxis protein CheW [Rhodospirillales bacterium]|nr:chemotaxis protein CheW [Rhodospirillales bacterium]
MTRPVSPSGNQAFYPLPSGDLSDFVTFVIAEQLFGVPILQVQDIHSPTSVAPVPLAPSEVKGSINRRGRIATVIDVRVRLGLEHRPDEVAGMGVTIEHHHALYTLLVDRVDGGVGLSPGTFENNPATISAPWREFADGVYCLDGKVMVLLNVERLLDVKT